MGRLIDADELLKEFDPNGERLDPIFVRSRIVQQPIAYNVEKVVAELEEKIDIYEHNIKNFASPVYHLYYAMATSTKEAFSEAMKIVKAGGVDD